MLTINKYSINFKSNPEREREMARLAQLKRDRYSLLQSKLDKIGLYAQNEEEENLLKTDLLRIFVAGETKKSNLNELCSELNTVFEKALTRALTKYQTEKPQSVNNKPDTLSPKQSQNNQKLIQPEEKEIKNALNEAQEKLINTMLPKSVLYPDVDNEFSKKMAGFFSQFTCAIQNNSEHDLQEFFADEETAQELREKLPPECQHDSLELRKEFQEIVETQDAIMMLMCANKMKNFAPKQGLMNDSQYKKYVEGLKNVIDTVIKNTDLTKFEPDEQNGILEMLQMIKGSQTVDFGISVKLKALVEKINKRKLNLGFIPPVQVKNLETTVKKNINKI